MRLRNAAAVEPLEYRTFAVRAESLRPEERSVEAVLTTDSAVPMWDWDRREVVAEVMLMSGAEFPQQVPLLDSHARYSMENQLGSTREIKTTKHELIGRLFFASTAEDEWTKVREGHATDVSVGYEIKRKTYIPRGESKEINGQKFTGPMNVVTKWRLREVSLTPIGADEEAKLRGLDPERFRRLTEEKGFAMNEQLRALLVSKGMPNDATDEQAQDWLLKNADTVMVKAKPESEGKAQPPDPLSREAIAKIVADAAEKAAHDLIEKREQRQAAFRKEVDALAKIGRVEGIREQLYGCENIEKVREAIQAEQEKHQTQLGAFIVPMENTGRENYVKEIGGALMLRCLHNANNSTKAIEAAYPEAERPKGAEKWRNASLSDLARECCNVDGIDTRGMSKENVAICALGFGHTIGVRMGPAYHTTGSFPKLTQTAFNKSLMLGYGEAPSTWQGPMRQGMSVPDFKTINRVRMGAIPNLPVWPDNTKPEEASFADAQEPYAVEAYSEKVSFSYRLIVNDDLDALSRVPAMLGNAARRTVNATAWAQITANPLLGDGIAAFSAVSGVRKRSNLTTGAGAPSVSTLQTQSNLMMQMRGENTPEGNEGPDVLALRPRYIVGPSALMTTIQQLVLSAYDPANANMTYNTATMLIPVIEPLLDTASTTAWYLFADPAQIDTVEVTFLQGQENPVTRNWMDEEYLSQHFAVLQSFGAKIMNYRGIVKHAGA